MNLVMSQVEESIHIVDVTDDGQALPPRVRQSLQQPPLAHKRDVEFLGDRREKDADCV